jgi:hypothetical protein
MGMEKWMDDRMGAWKGEMQNQVRKSEIRPQTSALVPPNILDLKPNDFGIRVLKQNFGEWGLRIFKEPLKGKMRETDYVVLGGLGNTLENGSNSLSSIARYPWEAFEEVGFRCVQDVKKLLAPEKWP